MMRRRRRSRSAGLKALQDAGPSRWSLVVGAAFGVTAMGIVLTLGLVDLNRGGWAAVASLPVIAFVIAGLADPNAVVARRAIVEYALLQRRRLPPDYPVDEAAAITWLADPAHAADDPIRRAFVLDRSGQRDAARDELARIDPSDTAALASAERLRAAWATRAGEPWDDARFEELVDRLSDDEARWQRLGLAFALLVEDIGAGRPWRAAYVRSVRDLGPWHTTARGWFVVLSQQFTLAIACGIPILLLWLLERA